MIFPHFSSLLLEPMFPNYQIFESIFIGPFRQLVSTES